MTFRENSTLFISLSRREISEILKEIESRELIKFKPDQYINIYVRLTGDNNFTYAREKQDLGTTIVNKADISYRLRSSKHQQRVLDALSAFEMAIKKSWPFMAGSHSWIELRISLVNKAIEMFRAVRLSSTNKEGISYNMAANKILQKALCEFSTTISGWSINMPTDHVLLDTSAARLFETGEISEATLSNTILKENHTNEFYVYSKIGKIRFIEISEVKKKNKVGSKIPTPIVVI